MPETNASRQTGQFKFFDSRKGFGFIKPDDGSRDVFVPLNNLPKDCGGSVMPDQRCSYVVDMGKKGPLARQIAFL